MLAAYLLGRRLWPRYAVVGVLAVGIAIAAATGRLQAGGVQWAFTVPVFTAPEFSWRATVSLALPLFIVTMASQNLPGVAAIRAAGYRVPISKIITLTGVATLVLAPFGAFALNLAAITAAICLGREAHADPDRRWVAAAANGVIYCVVGVFGAAVAGLLAAFPRELVIAVAGLALLGTIGLGPGRGAEGRAAPRGGADHLPGHALGRRAARRRLGVLGRGRRRDRALCATVAAPPRRTSSSPSHETALRRRPARSASTSRRTRPSR